MSTSVSHGYLPAGRYIVNHDIMHCTAEGVTGNDLYSGRALGLTEPDDYIQLHPVLKPMWNDIAGHYRRIGLNHTENVIWDVSLDNCLHILPLGVTGRRYFISDLRSARPGAIRHGWMLSNS
jgi:hypothetical protein